ncbi:MAG: TonB family protein [Ignavibacteriaceae bacterium]|nr:TonB family protein [Ignavibacteriaceae bacterium]
MFKKRDIELIILDVLGCPDEVDKKSLQFLKENDESFCWNELGECQNLSASLPSILKADKPSTEPREVLVRKLNRLIFGREDIGQPEKFVPDKNIPNEGNLEKVLTQNKIDWGSLSVAESSSKPLNGFMEVKSKTTSIEKESVRSDKTEEFSQIEESDTTYENHSDFQVDNKVNKTSRLKKYILVSILLFVVIASMSVYLFLINKSETVQVAEEKKPIDTVVAVVEEFSYDSVKGFEPELEISEVQQVEISDKPQNEKNVLPKAPPKLPDPIEAPVITTQEVVNEEEPKIEEEISAPPPKEVIEEAAEPTFFVAVEEMPQPIGGLQGIQAKISYPEIAKRAGVEGKVFIRAFVDETGTVVNAEVVKGIGGGCDEAALDAIMKTKFTPGKQRGKPIKVQVTVPVHFRL